MEQIKNRFAYPLILLKQLVKTDFKLRYQGSVLGYLWSLLRPLSLFTILYMVFVNFLKLDSGTPYYASYLLLGIVLWNFFAEITVGSVGSIVGKGDLLRKINFPRYVIVLASSVSAFINLLFNMIVIGILMAIQHVDISIYALLAPLLLIELYLFALGLAFLLSALYVKLRDLNYIWEVIMQAGFYATPIIYPFSKILLENETVAKILIMNPVAQIIQDMRYILITQRTETVSTVFGSFIYTLIPLSIVVVTFILCARYFRNKAKYFAEEV